MVIFIPVDLFLSTFYYTLTNQQYIQIQILKYPFRNQWTLTSALGSVSQIIEQSSNQIKKIHQHFEILYERTIILYE